MCVFLLPSFFFETSEYLRQLIRVAFVAANVAATKAAKFSHDSVPPWRESYFCCRRNVMQTASRSENATMLTHRPPLIVRLHVCETMANHASEITVSEGARVSANAFASNETMHLIDESADYVLFK